MARESRLLNEEQPELDAYSKAATVLYEDLAANPHNATDPYRVLNAITLQNQAHPITWAPLKKWMILSVYCLLQIFITVTTTAYVSIEYAVQERFGGSTQATTLGQSMFIVGAAIALMFLGPMADIAGRKWVYAIATLCYALLNLGTALATSLPMLVVFCFLIGCAGSVALSNVAGTATDLFGNTDGAGQALALFVWSGYIGPSIGSPIGTWIVQNPNMGWRWVFYLNVIIGGAFALLLCFVPETLPKVVIWRAVQNNESAAADAVDIARGSSQISFLAEAKFVATMTLRIMLTEPIVISLALYDGLVYGILFLYLDGVFDVFSVNNHLSVIDADLTYLNFCVGVTILFCCIPIQTYLYKRDRARNGGKGRPEARFLMALVVVWLFPTSLLWLAFTSDGTVSYWSPILAGTVLGFVDPLMWLSMMNYVTDSYPNVAASAVAAFLIPSFLIAGGLCHAGVVMFENLSTKWALAILGFVSFGIVGLVYVFYFFGKWLRVRSKLASA